MHPTATTPVGQANGVPVTTPVTFNDAVRDVIAEYAITRKSSKAALERRIAQRLTPTFGGRALVSITTTDVRAFTNQLLATGAAAKNINPDLLILRRAFRLALASGKYHHEIPAIPMAQEADERRNVKPAESLNLHADEKVQLQVDYCLRSIDSDVWQRVKERANEEGRSIRFVLLTALRIYAAQGFDPFDKARAVDRPEA